MNDERIGTVPAVKGAWADEVVTTDAQALEQPVVCQDLLNGHATFEELEREGLRVHGR